MNLKEIPPHTMITAVAAVGWLASFVLRAVNPAFALGPAADALMTTVVAYWMKANKDAKRDGAGLVDAVMNEVALPMIANAHPAPAPPPDGLRSPQAAPKPAPAPKPPAPPTTKGGSPWSS